MRITHIIWGLSTGGVEAMLVDIANEQAKLNDVSIIVINNLIDENVIISLDSAVHLYKCNRMIGSRSPLPFIRLNTYLLRSHPDIIHIQMTGFVRMLFVCRNVPKVFTVHNTHNSIDDYKCYDKLCSISLGVQKVTRNQGYESELVYNGIHTEKIVFKEKLEPSKTLRLLQVGRLEEVKGQQILLKSAELLVKKGVDFHIDLIGEGSNRSKLELFIKEHGLNGFVSFLGLKSREYIYKHLCEYDLLIQPSLSEGFGLTLAEAIVAGVQVITSEIEGPMEVISDGLYGKFFQVGNYHQLAETIMSCICSHAMCTACRARDYVIEKFDIKNTVSAYDRVYRSLTNGE